MRFGTGGGLLVDETVVIEGVYEGDGAANRGGFFFEPHEDGFAWVLVKERKECCENVGVGFPGEGIAMIYLERVVYEACSNVEEAKTRLELGSKAVVLALLCFVRLELDVGIRSRDDEKRGARRYYEKVKLP